METSDFHPRPLAGEGRGEGPAIVAPSLLPPHPNPLPHEDVVEREMLLWASGRR